MEDAKLPVEETPKVENDRPVGATVEVKPKKKASGCLIVFLIFLGLLLLLIGGAYLGYRKISKDLRTQVDLEVKYTTKDTLNLDSLVTITPENYLDIKDGIDISLTSAQVTAMLNAQSVSPTFSNTQIKFNKDNLEVSTLAKFELSEEKLFNVPLYVSADVEGVTKESLKLKIKDIKIGLLQLPNWIQERLTATEEEWLEGIILENLSSFDFKSIKLTNGRVDIEKLLLDDLR